MRKITFFILVLFCILGNAAKAQNLITNDDFNSGFASWNTGGAAWYNTFDGTNAWGDLTGSGYGNGKWLEQTIATQPGQWYQLSFNLGCWKDGVFTTGGAKLYINSVYKGRFENSDFSGNPMTWRRFTYCFQANSANTTIRFVGDAALTTQSPAWANVMDHARVIGLDKVSVYRSADLIVNGKFEQNHPTTLELVAPYTHRTQCSTTPTGWTSSGSAISNPPISGVQWCDIGQYGNFWIDLTDCGWDNGHWVEQTVATEPGQQYFLRFSLGASQWYTASAELYINNGLFGFYTVPHDGVTPLKWQSFLYVFTANSSYTSIKFKGASSSGHTQIIGLDNVSLVLGDCVPASGELPHDPGGQGRKNILDENIEMNLYPNPASDHFTITGIPNGNSTVEVYNIAGKLLMKKEVSGENTSVDYDVQTLPSGSYIVKVKTENFVKEFKLIKQ